MDPLLRQRLLAASLDISWPNPYKPNAPADSRGGRECDRVCCMFFAGGEALRRVPPCGDKEAPLAVQGTAALARCASMGRF
mmetsp:Transcript_111758/g.323037  ORF Transcript_111758/g.323037 Transcript_111758/m.323037 type:complete len:81 (+) Transcript_111758:342-584(+)